MSDVREILAWAVPFLEERGVPDARLDAELLLAEVLGTERFRLHLDPARQLSGEQETRFRAWIARRGGREPLQYILGRCEFHSLEFVVDPRVLIPRPETELLVETALGRLRRLPGRPLVFDLGSGSGTMAVVIAREVPAARVLAVDISPAAAACTRQAAVRHGVAERVAVVCGDLFSPFPAALKADVIVSNPPYVATEDLPGLQPEVGRFEPRLALDGGTGGLEVISRLVSGAADHLVRGGWLLFEAGWDQGERIAGLVSRRPAWRRHDVFNDSAGHPRVHALEKA